MVVGLHGSHTIFGVQQDTVIQVSKSDIKRMDLIDKPPDNKYSNLVNVYFESISSHIDPKTNQTIITTTSKTVPIDTEIRNAEIIDAEVIENEIDPVGPAIKKTYREI